MRRYVWLTLALSSLLYGGEIEQVERIAKEIETLRSDFQECRTQLLQGVLPAPKQELRALSNDEFARRENARIAQQLQQCENESVRLERALDEASATITQLKENARLVTQQMKSMNEETRAQVEAVRLEEQHKRTALRKALDEAQLRLKAIERERDKLRRKKVTSVKQPKMVEKVKEVEKLKTVLKVVPQLCEDPNPFPKLLKKETLR